MCIRDSLQSAFFKLANVMPIEEAVDFMKQAAKKLSLIHIFFLLVGFFHLFYKKLAGLIPEIVVTCIQLDLAVINICNIGADFV